MNFNKLEENLLELQTEYKKQLDLKIKSRTIEMQSDDNSHYLIYEVLGISNERGSKIDLYQNVGRFLYKYAGSFLEAATKLCFLSKFPDSKSHKIPNTIGVRPKTFEIDCLNGNNAIEIKWRDATTDGDHINKEHTRMRVIKDAGYKPIRVMFYYPNRVQSIKIQDKLKKLYDEIGGEFYSGENAYNYVFSETGFDLKSFFETYRGNII